MPVGITRPYVAPDKHRPAAWTQFNAAADIFDRELVVTPAYVAKGAANCNLVARMIAGDSVLCGHAHCAHCPKNVADPAPSGGHAVTHIGLRGGGKRRTGVGSDL